MTDAKLKSYVERVKSLIEQQKVIGADITQVCKDAREDDPDLEPSMIRFAARELLLDATKRAERDDKRHQYLHAVGLAVDMVSNGEVSLREAAKACGVSKSSVHRALAVPAVSQPEMHADDLGRVDLPNCGATGAFDACDYPRCDCHADDLGTAEDVRVMTADDLGDPLWVVDRDRAKFKEKIRRIASTIKPVQEVGAGDPRPEGTPDLTPPPFLDRRRAVTA